MIQEINKRNLKGTFVEIGCGIPVASAIFEHEGASNTIVLAISPYAKEEQERLYGTDYPRSVSLEFVKKVILTNKQNYPESKLHYASSFQIGSDICSHGWVGIFIIDEGNYQQEHYYHITFNSGLNRKEMIDEIKTFGIKLIWNESLLNHNPLRYTVDYSTNDRIFTLLSMKHNKDAIVLFDPKYKRLEEYLRAQGDNLNVYKGSFDILHEGHLSIASYTGDKDKCLFVISIDTYQKGTCIGDNLLMRINKINEAGYPVAIINQPYFKDLTNLLRNRGYKGHINMLMGRDTAIRLWEMKNVPEDDSVTFIYFDRNKGGEIPGVTERFKFVPLDVPISSTELRKQLENQ